MSWPLSIPPATDQTLGPQDQFKFTATEACTICFGGGLNIPSHTFAANETWGPPIPRPPANTNIPYQVVVPPNSPCSAEGPAQTGHVIHVGS
jgi:hypothetical protein